MESINQINPDNLKDFFRHICLFINESKIRDKANYELHSQINKIKTAPKKWIFNKEVEGLKHKVRRVVDIEKKLLKYQDDTKTIERLLEKIKHLETQNQKLKTEKNKAEIENKKSIGDINLALNKLRSRIEIFIRAKESRDKRIKELEKKASRMSNLI